MTTNHPAHGPVSLDRLHQIREILSKAATQSDGGNIGYAMADAVKVIDVAIAEFGAEPVLYAAEETLVYAKMGELHFKCLSQPMGDAVIPLFRHSQTAPEVPDDLLSMAASAIEDLLEHTDPSTSYYSGVWADVPGKLRAAMLQGAEPVSEHDELPLDYLQGHKDGLEWAAQLAEANHPQTGDWLYDDPIELARAIRKGPDMPTSQDGNSPVTPDGWIPVSDRMPPNKPGSYEYIVFESLNNRAHHDYWNVPDGSCDDFSPFWNHYGKYVTHWMPLPAAPQQEE